jgi:hypothetical protein
MKKYRLPSEKKKEKNNSNSHPESIFFAFFCIAPMKNKSLDLDLQERMFSYATRTHALLLLFTLFFLLWQVHYTNYTRAVLFLGGA